MLKELISPITGFLGVPNSWMSFATSYSKNSSRSGWKLGMAERPSVELVPAKPK